MEGNFTIVDLTTSGHAIISKEIIQVVSLKIRDWEVVSELHEYVMYTGEIEESVLLFSGITTDLLQDKGKPFSEVFALLNNFVKGDSVVLFNLPFYLDSLENRDCGEFLTDHDFIDPCGIMYRRFYAKHGLKQVCEANGITFLTDTLSSTAMAVLGFTKFCNSLPGVDFTDNALTIPVGHIDYVKVPPKFTLTKAMIMHSQLFAGRVMSEEDLGRLRNEEAKLIARRERSMKSFGY